MTYLVTYLGQYSNSYSYVYWKYIKGILRYLLNTNKQTELIEYENADLVG